MKPLQVSTIAVVLAAIAWLMAPPLGPQARAQSSDATPLYPQAGFGAVDGRTVYQAICQGCHMPEGQGARGAGEYPALAGNPKLAAAPYVAMMVIDGHAGMPGFGEILNDRQVAEVVGYVRSQFGNQYADTLSIEDVPSLRH
ncbi:c-type cytochrome [[Pseudomonas] boreopolis]|uniref:Cytochrome c6 n=1 Tax=Xanthomonas boreopolis TaxID=86183 RepID=A0A919F524_9XANT|nr:cytochrome c6 [[Pseudomonas] boreopolis]